MDDVTLSAGEIYAITGKTQPAAQYRALKRMGIRAYRRRDAARTVCVLREWLKLSAAANKTSVGSKAELASDGDYSRPATANQEVK